MMQTACPELASSCRPVGLFDLSLHQLLRQASKSSTARHSTTQHDGRGHASHAEAWYRIDRRQPFLFLDQVCLSAFPSRSVLLPAKTKDDPRATETNEQTNAPPPRANMASLLVVIFLVELTVAVVNAIGATTVNDLV